jgi:RimJ/RimL family protein N-acetyltransferase
MTGLFLTGEKIGLRAVRLEDAGLLAGWMNDDQVTYFMFTGQRPIAPWQVLEDLRRQLESPAHTLFMVEDRATGVAIGSAGLYDIHQTARKAEFRVLLGAKEFWNKGYGTEVTELLTFYGFDRLNLNKVWLGVTAENVGAVRAYQKAGFKSEGRLRQELYRNGRYYDAIRMSILREEYDSGLASDHARRFGANP